MKTIWCKNWKNLTITTSLMREISCTRQIFYTLRLLRFQMWRNTLASSNWLMKAELLNSLSLYLIIIAFLRSSTGHYKLLARREREMRFLNLFECLICQELCRERCLMRLSFSLGWLWRARSTNLGPLKTKLPKAVKALQLPQFVSHPNLFKMTRMLIPYLRRNNPSLIHST